MLKLESIDHLVLEAGTKGLPVGIGSISLGEARAAGWRLHGDLELPAAIVRRSALANNADWMKRFVAQVPGVVLCPHGKTTMAPQLMDRQLRDGAWGMTCATPAQLRCYRRFGVRRIIFANQIVGLADARWLAGELRDDPSFEIHIFVDSKEGVDLLCAAARQAGLDRPISLLLEVGVAEGRTGIQSLEHAITLARHIQESDGVELSGVATFEGIVKGGSDIGMEPYVEALFDFVRRVAEAIVSENLVRRDGEVILSAGGSRFFDLAAARLRAVNLDRETLIVLRSGCYISHDANHYEAAFRRMVERRALDPIPGKLENALEVWASLQSRPELGRAYANIGKRDISYDVTLPHLLAGRRAGAAIDPEAFADVRVVKLSDQHAHLAIPADSALQFGDNLSFGVSHPCTTFDKWRFLFEIDDNDIVVDIIATFF
jgi:D-serine dehydratase